MIRRFIELTGWLAAASGQRRLMLKSRKFEN